MRSIYYAIPFVPQWLVAIGALWLTTMIMRMRKEEMFPRRSANVYNYAPVMFYNRTYLRFYNFNSTFLVDDIMVKAYVYICLHPLGWEEY